eukprot:TRINITY_DN6969_c0_g1_i4.p1 TRINITY_DN6969_c0_g1~~TRINITY_DN6969_c0_g1_i4.p1  ORF type:complete len:172 (-),score=39.75 TRINITY_DN6969_c0_g1_i4:37-552(-)
MIILLLLDCNTGISWLLIYRTESYQKMKDTIDRNTKKVEKKKAEVEGLPATKQKQLNKKIDRHQEALTNANRDMTFIKFKSIFAVGFTMVALLSFLNSIFEGHVVARLPFEPISFVRGLTHRGLPGNDFYECSMTFIYVMASMSFRSNLQKWLGWLPRTANTSFFQPPEQK